MSTIASRSARVVSRAWVNGMRIKRATLVALLSALALRATCTEEKAGWTCESDGFWHENGVKS